MTGWRGRVRLRLGLEKIEDSLPAIDLADVDGAFAAEAGHQFVGEPLATVCQGVIALFATCVHSSATHEAGGTPAARVASTPESLAAQV